MEMNVLCVISIYLICIECFWVYANDIEKLTDERKSLKGQDTYSARVLAGERVAIKDYPYNALVLVTNKGSCGGAIIRKRWILTAGHCKTEQTDKFVVWVSLDHEHSGIGYPVQKSIQHPSYENVNHEYDYMLLKLNIELTLSQTVQLIPLGSTSHLFDREMLTLTGYGLTEQPAILPCFSCKGVDHKLDLHGVELELVSRDRCLRMRPKFRSVLSENAFCAGTKKGKAASCSGDSGSPLVSNGLLLGIVHGAKTFMYICAQTPGLVSSVPYVRDWILNVTSK